MSTTNRFELAQAMVESRLGQKGSSEVTDPILLTVPVQALPDNYSLRQLYNHVVENTDDKAFYSILILSSCLQRPERIIQEDTGPEYAQKLLSWLSKYSIPTVGLFAYDCDFKDNKNTRSHITLEHFQLRSKIVFGITEYLDTYVLTRGTRIDEDILLSWIAYTNLDDPWTSKALRDKAGELLKRHQGQSLAPDFIVDHVLTEFIRPLFSGSRAPAITSQGRKALNASSISLHQQNNLSSSSKSWKSHDVHAVAVFEWAVGHMDAAMIHKSWHLCIPPLLILLDDTSPAVRVRGLQVLIDILSKTPAKVLQQTGLDEVFEDTVIPILLLLPNTTPIEESLRVLKPAYQALFKLGQVRFPTRRDQSNRMKFLDRIMRQGVLQGLLHSRHNIATIELLLTQLVTLIEGMGINAVKHLKDLIPILLSILTDPFATSHPDLILSAVRAAQVLILNCWPRMTESVYRIELIKALVLCWTSIEDDGNVADEPRRVDLGVVKRELKVTFIMLAKSLEGRVDMTKELEPLVQRSPELKALFSMNGAGEITIT